VLNRTRENAKECRKFKEIMTLARQAEQILDCGGGAHRRHRFSIADTIPKAAWRFTFRRSPGAAKVRG
jgi:hypothetical protein